MLLPNEFFPTTDEIIAKMVAPFERRAPRRSRYEEDMSYLPFERVTVCDPSAGSGAILDYVAKRLNEQSYGGHMSEPKRLYCFETDAMLKATLQSKNYRQLGDDFLAYTGDMPISVILMNPPFSNGDAHCLKAWQVISPGGDIACLLNSETIRNPYTQTRKELARLIEQYGSVEELGQCFLDSERTTDVEVSLIRLTKPDIDNAFSFDWHNVSKEKAFDTSKGYQNDVQSRDVIGTMLTQYDCLREQFMNLLRAADGIRHYGAGLLPASEHRDAWRIAQEIINSSSDKKASYAAQYVSFTEEMRQGIWRVVLQKVNIQKFMTNQVRENFTKFSTQQGYMDFTKENVAQLVGMVLDNTGNILEVAIGTLFDKFTQYHYENRCHVEGWKTNSRYKTNRKLILPNWVDIVEYGEFRTDYRNREKYADVDKVLCYLTGANYDKITLISDALEAKFRQLGKVGSGTFDNVCHSHFFKIRFFKKGTIHLEFLDPKLHEEFNLRACAGKLWLPDEEMQAYQTRKTSPFPKATPAPGTDMAANYGLAERAVVMQQLLGPPASSTPQVFSSPEPTDTVQMSVATNWSEDVQVIEEAAEVVQVAEIQPEPVTVPVVVVAEPTPEPVKAAPVVRRLAAAPPRKGRNVAAVGQFSLFDAPPVNEPAPMLAAA